MKAELVLEGYCTQWVKNDCTIIPNGHENDPIQEYVCIYIYVHSTGFEEVGGIVLSRR